MGCYELQQALESANKMAASAPTAGLSAAAQRNRAYQAVERVSEIQQKLVRHKKLSSCMDPLNPQIQLGYPSEKTLS
jgi:hypothetical protein